MNLVTEIFFELWSNETIFHSKMYIFLMLVSLLVSSWCRKIKYLSENLKAVHPAILCFVSGLWLFDYLKLYLKTSFV